MKRTGKMLAVALMLPLMGGAPAVAQEGDQSEIESLKKGQEELRKEIKGVRNDLKKVLRELAAIKAGQGKARPKRTPDLTVYDIKVDNSPVLGPKDAPVTIVEFSDFQCPYCIRENTNLKKIREEYPNDVKVVYKHFPLSFHKKAPPAHAATVLAYQEKGDEGFWKMHDLIVGNPKKIDKPQLRKYAEQLGLDLAKFDEVMADNAKIAALYKDDVAEARKCKVRGTPTVLINGLKLAQRNYDGYKARIDELLKAKKKG